MFTVIPYFNFPNALEALTYYEETLGAKVTSKFMANDPLFGQADADEDVIMNAEFELLGQRFMLSTTPDKTPVNNEGVYVAFNFDGKDQEAMVQAQAFYERAIQSDSQILVPLGATPWSPLYGMFTDPFGISWMVNAR
ncbi:VOC family protein [Vaginisenegalia massiliensis]|uniref:VOC family protein n=1 Tax=Vaginisenegalia massiliensis TaxID=2058294 RepID=UPI000F52B213|nr:VOC family protein [Vaginisenegalia massiliensis]